jgi:hypothetical protein
MANPPEVSPEERARQRQELAARAMDRKTDAAVEVASTIAAWLALCAHVLLVALGAWMTTRSGPLIGTAGAAVLLVDAILCMFALVPMVRIALEHVAVRGLLVAASAAVALVALPTVLASLIGKLGPFQPLSMKVGLLALVVLLFLAAYGAVSAWLVWLLGFQSAEKIRKHSMLRDSI